MKLIPDMVGCARELCGLFDPSCQTCMDIDSRFSVGGICVKAISLTLRELIVGFEGAVLDGILRCNGVEPEGLPERILARVGEREGLSSLAAASPGPTCPYCEGVFIREGVELVCSQCGMRWVQESRESRERRGREAMARAMNSARPVFRSEEG